MNCTVVITKEYKRPLVLETLITTDLALFSMNDRFDRVNRSFINMTYLNRSFVLELLLLLDEFAVILFFLLMSDR